MYEEEYGRTPHQFARALDTIKNHINQPAPPMAPDFEDACTTVWLGSLRHLANLMGLRTHPI